MRSNQQNKKARLFHDMAQQSGVYRARETDLFKTCFSTMKNFSVGASHFAAHTIL